VSGDKERVVIIGRIVFRRWRGRQSEERWQKTSRKTSRRQEKGVSWCFIRSIFRI